MGKKKELGTLMDTKAWYILITSSCLLELGGWGNIVWQQTDTDLFKDSNKWVEIAKSKNCDLEHCGKATRYYKRLNLLSPPHVH